MNKSNIIKIGLALLALAIIGGLVYYFLLNPTAKYDKLISNADELFDAGRLNDAKTEYGKAMEIKGEEAHPRRQLMVIDSISHIEELNIRYDENIQKADEFFEAKDYRAASEYYFMAANILPMEDYPLNQINLIQALIKDPNYVAPEKKSEPVAKVEISKSNPPPAKKSTTRTPSPALAKKTVSSSNTGPGEKIADGKYYHVVVGTFSNHNSAVELNKKMIDQGRESQILRRPGNMEAVTFGSYPDFNTAESFLEFVKNDINKDAWVLFSKTK